MMNAEKQQERSQSANLTPADYVAALPDNVKRAVRMSNFDSSIAKFVYLEKRYCAIEIRYRTDNDGTFSCNMAGPDVSFHSQIDCVGLDFWKKDPVAKSNFFELVTVREGTFDFFFGDGRETLHCGESALLNPNLSHRKEYPENCELVEILISTEMMRQLVRSVEREKGVPIIQSLNMIENSDLSSEKIALFFRPSSDDRIFPLLSSILSELAEKQPGYLSISAGYIERLVSALFDQSLYSSQLSRRKVSRAEMIFRDVNLLLEKNKYKLSGGEIQKELGYNKDYLNRIVKTYSGMSLKEYCDYKKMQQVAAMLRDTDKSINEIIEEMDFSGSSTFYRQFKKFFQTSPDEFRARSKG